MNEFVKPSRRNVVCSHEFECKMHLVHSHIVSSIFILNIRYNRYIYLQIPSCFSILKLFQ